jgi:hypothetical protein
VQSSRGSTVVVRSDEEEDLDHWFLRPGGAQEKPTEGRDRESLDLIQKSRQSSDRTRVAQGLSQGEIPKGGLTHRGFTYWESREPMHCGIEKLETLTSGKTTVMGITVIWARSLARRASA